MNGASRSAGQYCTDEDMKEYVKYIVSIINTKAGTHISSSTGFPMKGNFIPVDLTIKEIKSTYLIIHIKVLEFEKEFEFYLSRHFAPFQTLRLLQSKIDEIFKNIVEENKLDKDQLNKKYHPFNQHIYQTKLL